MAEKMAVKCIRRCYDNKTCIRYYPGDIEEVDPLSSLALYFEFPPGAKVHCKKKVPDGLDLGGKAKFKMVHATRIVGGAPEPPEAPEMISCEFCGQPCKGEFGKQSHQRHCEAALMAGKTDGGKSKPDKKE